MWEISSIKELLGRKKNPLNEVVIGALLQYPLLDVGDCCIGSFRINAVSEPDLVRGPFFDH